ncbi:MAG TPA: RNA-directed DNA polymerase [Actinomycetota bacterium]|nr:RNA-directed DNA polymerase [Actinomycetota bacterium]
MPAKRSRYRPDPIRSFSVPKPGGGGWRRFAILSERDDRRWEALAGAVAGVLEPHLDPRVAANRAVVSWRGWRLEPTGVALRRARALAPRSGLLLHTDVEDFYASITPSVLTRTLALVGASQQSTRLAGDMIDGWSDHGYPGLPIGPVGSAVLANAVLVGVDRALRSLRFVRWVDDYVIGVPSEGAAGGILERMDDCLAGLGLRRSARKTRILEGHDGIAWLRGKLSAPASTAPAENTKSAPARVLLDRIAGPSDRERPTVDDAVSSLARSHVVAHRRWRVDPRGRAARAAGGLG